MEYQSMEPKYTAVMEPQRMEPTEEIMETMLEQRLERTVQLRKIKSTQITKKDEMLELTDADSNVDRIDDNDQFEELVVEF